MAAACDVGTAIEAYVARSGRPGIDADICNLKGLYSSQHINESKVLHKYVMNEFFVACCSHQTKYFWEKLF